MRSATGAVSTGFSSNEPWGREWVAEAGNTARLQALCQCSSPRLCQGPVPGSIPGQIVLAIVLMVIGVLLIAFRSEIGRLLEAPCGKGVVRLVREICVLIVSDLTASWMLRAHGRAWVAST